MEGAHYMKHSTLPSLSEQQLVDCAKAEGNMGCNGGLMDYAFDYAKANMMDTETDYPYKGRDGKCSAKGTIDKIVSYEDVTPEDPEALSEALKNGPVSVAVDGAALAFQFYFGGIVKHFCGTSLDHGVLLVGQGTEGETDYWIIKNSWGASWGEKGYIRVERDMSKKSKGVCGEQSQPSQPSF
jgi:C1A family cysteine protease